jgi:AcrR family transcriptional regulator
MRKNRKEEILQAAVDLFAGRGFRGTTTRDLAEKAGVNEALIFRYFKTKSNLYRAIFDFKLSGADREAKRGALKKLEASKNETDFLEMIARDFLRKHRKDTTFARLLLFSALESNEFVDIVLQSLSRQNPLAQYMQSRIDQGVFRKVNPHLAAGAFFGMLFNFILMQEIIGAKKFRRYSVREVAATCVSIFLQGMKICPSNEVQDVPCKTRSPQEKD